MGELFGTEPAPSEPAPRDRRLFFAGIMTLVLAGVLFVGYLRARVAEPRQPPSTDEHVALAPEGASTAAEPVGTEVDISAWRIVTDITHDVKNASNAVGAPDQKDSVILPGGELALAYAESEYLIDGAGDDLRLYGTAGDTTPYTLFGRGDTTEPWVRVGANPKGFLQGAAAHDIQRLRVRHIKIRNDGATNLFLDAVVALNTPSARTTPLAPAMSRPRSEPQPPVQPWTVANAAREKPASVSGPPPSSQPVGQAAQARERNDPQAPQTEVLQAVPSPPAAVPQRPELEEVDPRPPGASSPAVVEERSPVAVVTPARPQGAGTLELPQKIKGMAAQYPKVAQAANVEGTVVIRAVIDTNGRVTDARISKSVPLLDQAALDAVRQWQFKPGLQDGRPVSLPVTLSVTFTLK